MKIFDKILSFGNVTLSLKKNLTCKPQEMAESLNTIVSQKETIESIYI